MAQDIEYSHRYHFADARTLTPPSGHDYGDSWRRTDPDGSVTGRDVVRNADGSADVWWTRWTPPTGA